MSNDDPFAPENDPYRHESAGQGEAVEEAAGRRAEAQAANVLNGPARFTPVKLCRREFTLLTVLSAAALGGCAHPGLGCAPKPSQPTQCRHRFCRYYKG